MTGAVIDPSAVLAPTPRDPSVSAPLADATREAQILHGRRLFAVTGAGLSTDSGIPDYRGPDSPPRAPMTYDEFTSGPIAQQRYWARSHLGWQRMGRAVPNTGHVAMAALSGAGVVTALITQNVDGLHELAGAGDVIRLHGSIWRLRCALDCGEAPVSWEDRRTPLPELPPRCPGCGGYARPAVVWFGEALDNDVLDRSISATACDVYLSIGTSSLVQPAAGLVARARSRGAYTVEINPVATDAVLYLDEAIALPAEVALPAMGL